MCPHASNRLPRGQTWNIACLHGLPGSGMRRGCQGVQGMRIMVWSIPKRAGASWRPRGGVQYSLLPVTGLWEACASTQDIRAHPCEKSVPLHLQGPLLSQFCLNCLLTQPTGGSLGSVHLPETHTFQYQLVQSLTIKL